MGFVVVHAKNGQFYSGVLTIKRQQVPRWVSQPKLAGNLHQAAVRREPGLR